ncbi:MAG: permease [Dongiaceae bacterium]
MSNATVQHRPRWSRRHLWLALAGAAIIGIALAFPTSAMAAMGFIAENLAAVAPLVLAGLLLSAWVMASGLGDHMARVFQGRPLAMILLASAIGAVTPVCGVTVLPLMAGLLLAGVPLAPVMAFWLSSPVTDPGMFAATAATLGLSFAIGKTLAAFGIGMLGGIVTAYVAGRPSITKPLRESAARFIGGGATCGTSEAAQWAIWKDATRRRQFVLNFAAMTKLVAICLTLAFGAEYYLREWLAPEALAVYVGDDTPWAIPLAVLVGSPIYLDGYAALPLVRGLMDRGMSQGAAMAFLVSGSVVSIWGAVAVFPVLRWQPFVLYLVLAVVGSMLIGWTYGFAVS